MPAGYTKPSDSVLRATAPDYQCRLLMSPGGGLASNMRASEAALSLGTEHALKMSVPAGAHTFQRGPECVLRTLISH